MEKLGRCRESSILNGCLLLFDEGELFLGAIVALSAFALPPVKLGMLLWLGTASAGQVTPGRLARTLESVGRFSCLEVFLTAVLVALVRLDAVVRFQPRAGLYAFALSALLGVTASIALNQRPGIQVKRHEPCTA
jgi:paraquat-inducible protein A